MNAGDFRAFAHLLPDACLLIKADGEILGANPAAERLLRASRKSLEGGSLLDLVAGSPDDVRTYLASAARTRGPVSGGLTFRCTDEEGEEGETEIACTCLGGLVTPPRDGESACLLLRVQERGSSTNRFRLLNEQVDRLSNEVRRRQRAEHELERRAAQLEEITTRLERSRALLEESQRSASVGSWEWDLGTGALTWSEELYRIYGLDATEGEITFDRFQSRIHPEDRDMVQETIAEATESGEPFSFEHRIVRPDGVIRVMQSHGRGVTGPDGSVIMMLGSGQDVTERKREEERARFLAESGHLLTTSLDYQETLGRVAELAVPHIADWAAVDVIQDGEVHRLAVAHPDPAKLALVEEIARRWPEDPQKPGAVTRVQRTGEPLLLPEIPASILEESAQGEEHLRMLRELGLRSAMIVPLEARDQILGSITFVASESGRTFGEADLNLARELADRAALAVDNARLYQESQQASRARDDMVAIVSHDLRSPLNAVLAGASLLLEVPLSDEKRRAQYTAIRRSAERMERLTRDLLDITRIESGHLKVEPRAEDVRALVAEALEAATFAAGRTGVFLSSDVPDDIPRARADRARMLQVLDNLLSNAIRHTPEGGRVTAAVEAQGKTLRFQVADTGEGIPEELRDHVFDRYWQGEQSDHGGAGLGLPIAKGIVDAHGGRIWIETTPNRGTTFYFTLPVATGQDEEDGSAVA